jgi:glutamate/tyrosine decarboxylase-like PLP-dependent enzyme
VSNFREIERDVESVDVEYQKILYITTKVGWFLLRRRSEK